jgi:hypothetical protein
VGRGGSVNRQYSARFWYHESSNISNLYSLCGQHLRDCLIIAVSFIIIIIIIVVVVVVVVFEGVWCLIKQEIPPNGVALS